MPMATEKDYLIVGNVPGWCDFTEFYSYIAELVPNGGMVCEVGTWLGSSAIHLARELQKWNKTKTKIVCVDTWAGGPEHETLVKDLGGPQGVYEAFMKNVEQAGVLHAIRPVIAPSLSAAKRFKPRSFHSVFIDADHSAAAVRADIAAWAPKVKRGGILAGHDYDYASVRGEVSAYSEAAGVRINEWGRVWWSPTPGKK